MGRKVTLRILHAGSFLPAFYFWRWIDINKADERKSDALVNEKITADEVLVVDDTGKMLGAMKPEDGMRLAEAKGLDLVCVAPNAPKPVCKMMDYNKFRYEKQKRERIARKRQTIVSLKEIRLTPVISENDFRVKLNRGKEFLSKGNKLKVTLRFHRRERLLNMGSPDIQILKKFIAETQDCATVESEPTLEGKNVSMMLVAKKNKK